MNWNLIFRLSLFGLFMAIATVYFIPSNIEPICWLVIFVICAIIIARNCASRFFLVGLLVSLVNSVWITSTHILLYHTYILSHVKEAEMMGKLALPTHPRLMMLISGPIVGLLSGLVLGLFSLIASKLIRKRSVA
jgi:uncharacterized membrane protein